MSIVDNVIKISKEHEQKGFLREIAISLSQQKETPTDILKSQFKSIDEFEKEYICVEADVDLNYSCTIGYDKEVSYYENGNKKTKTVTDWQPFCGTYQSEESIIVGNGNDQEEYRNRYAVVELLKSCKQESVKDTDDRMTINANALEDAKGDCIASSFYSIRLPGDRQKDKEYSGRVDVKKVTGIIVPQYATSYSYQEKEYAVNGFASGDMQIEMDYPSIAEDVNKEAKKKAAPFKWAGLGALALGVILNIIDMNLCWIGYVPALGLCITYFIMKNKASNSIFSLKKEKKKEELIAFLQKNQLKPLTEEELKKF